jgi:hypothetical protein
MDRSNFVLWFKSIGLFLVGILLIASGVNASSVFAVFFVLIILGLFSIEVGINLIVKSRKNQRLEEARIVARLTKNQQPPSKIDPNRMPIGDDINLRILQAYVSYSRSLGTSWPSIHQDHLIIGYLSPEEILKISIILRNLEFAGYFTSVRGSARISGRLRLGRIFTPTNQLIVFCRPAIVNP